MKFFFVEDETTIIWHPYFTRTGGGSEKKEKIHMKSWGRILNQHKSGFVDNTHKYLYEQAMIYSIRKYFMDFMISPSSRGALRALMLTSHLSSSSFISECDPLQLLFLSPPHTHSQRYHICCTTAAIFEWWIIKIGIFCQLVVPSQEWNFLAMECFMFFSVAKTFFFSFLSSFVLFIA